MAEPVIMPKLGVYNEDVLLSEWAAAEGARVEPGEVLFLLETDKTTAEVEAEVAGWLHREVEAGAKVPIGAAVGVVATTREEYESLTAGPRDEPAHPFLGYIGGGGPQTVVAAPAAAPVEARPARRRDGSRAISPRARAFLARHGVSLEDAAAIVGSGPGGRVIERDVVAFVDRAVPSEPHVAETIPLRGRRKTIATRMVESLQTTAQLTSVLEIDVAPVVELRNVLNAAGASPRIGYTAIFVKLVAAALRRHPLLNSRVAGDEIQLFADINVGVAVDASEGLVVPVVHGADRLSLVEVNARCAELVEAARARKLTPTDVAGGTFTLSNGGIYPVDITTAILNPPQAAILWLGRIRERPFVVDGAVAVRPTLQACLTYDHRVVDGAPAAEFLGTLESLVRALPELPA